jgi:hypothetical protein
MEKAFFFQSPRETKRAEDYRQLRMKRGFVHLLISLAQEIDKRNCLTSKIMLVKGWSDIASPDITSPG